MFKREPLHNFASHYCFGGDTLITTPDGYRKISDIKVGDIVCSLTGDVKVISSESVGKKPVVNFFGTLVTKNHPYCTQRGFVPLDAIRYNDTLMVCEKKYNMMGYDSIVTQIQIGEKIGFIFSVLNRVKQAVLKSDCTDMFGKNTMVKYLKDLLYITKTAIRLIMKLIIWNALAYPSIEAKGISMRLLSLEKSQLKLPENMQYYGINLKKEENFIDGLEKKGGKKSMLFWLKNHVKCVALYIKHLFHHDQNSAEITAKLPQGTEEEQVYNLCTENGTFIANGFLVSNSDALRYMAVAEPLMTNSGNGLTDEQKKDLWFKKLMREKKKKQIS